MNKVLLPALAEGVNKATVSYWYRNPGDKVVAGEDLVELATDKATFNLPAPVSGTLKETLVAEGEDAAVGQEIAIIE